jgi:hypothetical protein
MAMLAVVLPGTAQAVSTDPQAVTGNVDVGSTIALTLDETAFTLSGNAGDTVSTGATPVGMTVTTNNIGGYTVTVTAAASTLAPQAVGNSDSIPIADLDVRGDAPAAPNFTPMATTPGVTVHSQTEPSAETGDDLTNDYRMTIPFVRSDTYSVTLNYVATTL